MSEVTIPVPHRALTWDDLQALPDELHHHFELIDGEILMSPSPSRYHQRAVFRLAKLLDAAAGEDLEALVAPFDFVPVPSVSLQPDVLVVRRDDDAIQRTVEAPLLVVEVLSPSGRTSDRTTKRALYERYGVEHYWLVDPDEPSVEALRLDEAGVYRQVAVVRGTERFETTAPFTVSVVPAELV